MLASKLTVSTVYTALAWSYMVLGWAAALIVTFILAVSTWYTSYTLWQYCMKHPRKRLTAVILTVFY